jgi:hypothetical protein
VTEPLLQQHYAMSNSKEAANPSSTSQVLIEFNNLKSVLTDYEDFNQLLYNPNNQDNPGTILKKLNAVTDCNSPPYTEYGENINFNNDCTPAPAGGCHSSDVWVWDVSQCPPGSTPWVSGTAVNTAVRYCMNFGETWASDPSVHNRYTPAGTTCTNGGQTYKQIAEDLLTKLKDHHTDVRSSMNSVKNSLDTIFNPSNPATTASVIGQINSLITDDITPILTLVESQL